MAKLNTKSDRTHKLVLTGLFAALIAIGAFIKVDVPGVPFTMQMCFVNLAGLILGGMYGGLSALVYLIIGLVGVPIFAQGGGFSYVFKGSFGYIVGFVLAAAACGFISHAKGKVTYKSMILGTLATFVCVYACGLTHAYLISVFHTEEPLAAKTLLVSYFLMFLPGDILTCAASIFVAKKLLPILERQGYRLFKTKEEKAALATDAGEVVATVSNTNVEADENVNLGVSQCDENVQAEDGIQCDKNVEETTEGK